MSDKFTYTYSSPTPDERKEIERIRDQYIQRGKTSLEKLKELDQRVKRLPTMFGLVLGIIGVLVFGLGMAMVLEWKRLILGSLVSMIGAVCAGCAYPVYRVVFLRNKKKYADEIIALSNTLLHEDDNHERN
ncbi:MAG TPA: hypothetical protein IAD46_02390 [Candidatus Pelethenecus faecipullorum]|uniref:Uncharacterized protein n=1 Tax=Candidatus Pelethenecus faecipullorum TaxID=2840900 RepID=A0A9D1GQ83_9MOLU|nr:hypothetical protein [Candidatus Pelethenecus faecipullorum]